MDSSGLVIVFDYLDIPGQIEAGLSSALHLSNEGHSVCYVHLGGILPSTEFRWIGLGRHHDSRKPRYFWNLVDRYQRLSFIQLVVRKSLLILGIGRKIGVSAPVRVGGIVLGRYAVTTAKFLLFERGGKHFDRAPKERMLQGQKSTLSTFSGRETVTSPNSHLTKRRIKRVARAQRIAFLFSLALLRSLRPASVVVPNPRLAVSAALISAAELAKVPVLVHDPGFTVSGRFFLGDFMPHDFLLLGQKMKMNELLPEVALMEPDQVVRSLWSSENKAFVNKGFRRGESSFEAFLSSPRSVGGRPRLLFLVSNEEETRFLPPLIENSKKVFPSQVRAVEYLARLADREGYKLTVRVHPSLKKNPQDEQDLWDNLNFGVPLETFRVVKCESDENTFALIAEADVVILWGSSLGVWSFLKGVPTVDLTRTPWAEFLQYESVDAASDLEALIRKVVDGRKVGTNMQNSLEMVSDWGRHYFSFGFKYPRALADYSFTSLVRDRHMEFSRKAQKALSRIGKVF